MKSRWQGSSWEVVFKFRRGGRTAPHQTDTKLKQKVAESDKWKWREICSFLKYLFIHQKDFSNFSYIWYDKMSNLHKFGFNKEAVGNVATMLGLA